MTGIPPSRRALARSIARSHRRSRPVAEQSVTVRMWQGKWKGWESGSSSAGPNYLGQVEHPSGELIRNVPTMSHVASDAKLITNVIVRVSQNGRRIVIDGIPLGDTTM